MPECSLKQPRLQPSLDKDVAEGTQPVADRFPLLRARNSAILPRLEDTVATATELPLGTRAALQP